MTSLTSKIIRCVGLGSTEYFRGTRKFATTLLLAAFVMPGAAIGDSHDVDLGQVSNISSVCSADGRHCAFSFFISNQYGAQVGSVGPAVCMANGMLVVQTVENGLAVNQVWSQAGGTFGTRAGIVMCLAP